MSGFCREKNIEGGVVVVVVVVIVVVVVVGRFLHEVHLTAPHAPQFSGFLVSSMSKYTTGVKEKVMGLVYGLTNIKWNSFLNIWLQTRLQTRLQTHWL